MPARLGQETRGGSATRTPCFTRRDVRCYRRESRSDDSTRWNARTRQPTCRGAPQGVTGKMARIFKKTQDPTASTRRPAGAPIREAATDSDTGQPARLSRRVIEMFARRPHK